MIADRPPALTVDPSLSRGVEFAPVHSSFLVTSTRQARDDHGRAMQYILLLYGCDRPEPGDPRFDGALGRLNAFAEECRRRGAFVAADPLKPVATATTVRVRKGQTLITDGPFAETHEQLGGYIIVECPGLDEALDLASMCPVAYEGSVEVRPLDVIPGWFLPSDPSRTTSGENDRR
jgi:hypothetical protein